MALAPWPLRRTIVLNALSAGLLALSAPIGLLLSIERKLFGQAAFERRLAAIIERQPTYVDGFWEHIGAALRAASFRNSEVVWSDDDVNLFVEICRNAGWSP